VSETEPKHEALRYFVSGNVQGVGYRFFARRTAEELGLAGFVRNLDDGRVEAYAIGPVESLAAFRIALERGPRGSAVSQVLPEIAQIDRRFAKSFSIE
jgi:acylphosphatase